MYNKGGFDDKAKYGILHKPAMEHSRLSEFLLIGGSGKYTSMKEDIAQYARTWELFISKFLFEDSSPASSTVAVIAMRDDVRKIETRLHFKLDMLTENSINGTLTLNKKTVEFENPPVNVPSIRTRVIGPTNAAKIG